MEMNGAISRRNAGQEAYGSGQVTEEQAQQTVQEGTQVEAEHADLVAMLKAYLAAHGELPPDEVIFEEIAQQHLSEDVDYYKKLAVMEGEHKNSDYTDVQKKAKAIATEHPGWSVQHIMDDLKEIFGLEIVDAYRQEITAVVEGENKNAGAGDQTIIDAYESLAKAGMGYNKAVQTLAIKFAMREAAIEEVLAEHFVTSLADARRNAGARKYGSERKNSLPEEMIDEAVEKREDGMGYKEIVEGILDYSKWRSWFESYSGNEFDLRQDIEEAVLKETGKR
jgi:hypothetical protein